MAILHNIIKNSMPDFCSPASGSTTFKRFRQEMKKRVARIAIALHARELDHYSLLLAMALAVLFGMENL